MKHFNTKLLALILALAAVFTVFAGCGNGDALEGKATIVLHGQTDTTYELDLKESGFKQGDNVYTALKWLYDNKDMPFSANTVFDNGFDAFINSVGTLKPTYGTTEYVAFYHNDEDNKDTSIYAQEDIIYNETTLYYSSVGVGGLKLYDGLIVYFTILSY